MTTSMSPDDIVYNQLVATFGASQVGPGSIVYHNPPGTDPITPYVTYLRTSTDNERDLAGELVRQEVTYSIQCLSMFYDEVSQDMSSLDNWASGSWFFNLTGQTIDGEQWAITWELMACSASPLTA